MPQYSITVLCWGKRSLLGPLPGRNCHSLCSWQLGFRVSLLDAMSKFSLPPTPSQTEAWVCWTMGECTTLSSIYNPKLSANKHVQICRFLLSAAADLADGSRDFQRRRTKLKRHWKIAHFRRSPTVSARLCYRGSNSVVFVYPLSNLLSKAELLPFEQEKYIKLVSFSCLKYAKETLLGDPRQAALGTQIFNYSIVHQSLDPTAHAPRSLSIHARMNQSSTFRLLASTSALEHLSIESLSHWVRLRMRCANPRTR